jgi:hypothetical protein
MNANQTQWNPAAPRKSAAAIAAVAATLIFSSVIGLFASDNPPAGAVSAAPLASAQSSQVGPTRDKLPRPAGGRLASATATTGKL